LKGKEESKIEDRPPWEEAWGLASCTASCAEGKERRKGKRKRKKRKRKEEKRKIKEREREEKKVLRMSHEAC